jgi:hypothetical protein
MKQSMSVFLGILLVGSTVACGKGSNPSSSSNLSTTQAAVPAGTKFEVTLPADISTSKNHNQDKLLLPVHSPLVGANPTLKGAKVEAHLEDVVKAERGKKASLHLVFDDIMFKDGTTEPLDAVLTETKVETKTQGKFIKNAGLIIGGAVAGHFAGKAAGVKHGGLAGAGAVTAFVLSSPGGDVVIKKGTELDLKLKSPLEMAKAGS